MSYVSSVSAYSSAAPITPARTNPDYAASRQTAKAAQPDQQRTSFGPAAKVTLSPEAQAYLQSQAADQTQKTDQARKADVQQTETRKTEADKTEKSTQVGQADDADAKAKTEKAAAARKAYEAQHAAQVKATAA